MEPIFNPSRSRAFCIQLQGILPGGEVTESMTSTVPPLRTQVPLHPILYFFNIVLNFLLSFVYFLILWFYCHFNIGKRAIRWIFIRVIIGFVHFIVLHFFISFFFFWKKNKRYGSGYTTFYSIIYITVLSVEFAWVVIGSVFYSKYIPEVHLPNFPLVMLTYLICSWVELIFLPSLFLFLLIVQLRRYRRHRRVLAEQTAEPVDPALSFATGGCCACCVNDDEGRCCCCYCACCEPAGISASYILGEIPTQDVELGEGESGLEEERCCGCGNESEEEERGHGCCCCGKREEESVVPAVSDVSPVPVVPIAPAVSAVSAVPVAPAVSDVPVVSTVPVAPAAPVTPAAPAVSITQTTHTTTLDSQEATVVPQTQEDTPTIYIPSTQQNVTLHDIRLVRAVADDGSGRTVLIALPYRVCFPLTRVTLQNG